MAYVLVEKQQIVHLGPIAWKQRFIQSELDDLEVTGYKVPPVEQGYVKINADFEIFPIDQEIIPEYDPIYEQLVGPTYTYNENTVGYATMYYTKQDSSLETVKNNIKNKVAQLRYTKEVSGIEQTVNGVTVQLATSREKRDQFNTFLTSVGDGTVEWKFDEGFVTLNKSHIQFIIDSIHSHIQTQFAWEKTLCDQIDVANDIDTLKAITIE
jgi:hypothetical protein